MYKNREGSATAQFTSNKITGGGPEVEGESKKALIKLLHPGMGPARERGGAACSFRFFWPLARSLARSHIRLRYLARSSLAPSATPARHSLVHLPPLAAWGPLARRSLATPLPLACPLMPRASSHSVNAMPL